MIKLTNQSDDEMESLLLMVLSTSPCSLPLKSPLQKKPWEGGGYVCIEIGGTPSQLLHFTCTQTVQCHLLQHVYMHTLQHGNLSTPELGPINYWQLPSPVNTCIHTSIVLTHSEYATLTWSRGHSLSPSARSSGRGLVQRMDTVLSWGIAWPHMATAEATWSLTDASI